MTRTRIFSILQIAVGFAIIGCASAAGYENYQLDQCNHTFDDVAAANEVRIDNVHVRIEKARAREASLEARSNGPIKKFDGPDGGQGIKQ